MEKAYHEQRALLLEAKLLALNAQLEAARAGEGAAPFACETAAWMERLDGKVSKEES